MPPRPKHESEVSSIDQFCTALASKSRRSIPQYFKEQDIDRATLEELSAAVIAQEPAEADPETVKLRLHHVALPKLDEVGVLKYDPQDRCAYYEEDNPVDEWIELVETLTE